MEVRNIEGALSAWNNYEKEMRRLPREIVEAQERAERVALDIIDGVGAEVDLRMERFFKTQVSKFSRQVKYFGEGIEANELLGEHLMAIEVGGDSDVDFAREKFVRGVRQLYLSKLGNIVRGFDSRLARRQRGLSRLGWWAFGLDIGGGGYEFELETLDEVNDEIEICERWLDELDQGAMLPAEISGDPGKLRLFLEQWKKRFNMGHGRKYLSRPEIKAMPALFVGGINMALDGNVDWHEFGPWVRRETEARLETLVDVRGLMEDADRYRNIVNQTSILLNVDEVKGREFEYEHNEDAWRIIEDELELGVQVKQWNTLRASHLPAEVYEQLDRLGNDVTEVEEIFEIRRGMIGGLQVEFESIDDLQAQLKERINILESERKEHQTTYRLLKAINETIGKNRIMPWKEFETGGRLSSVMKAVNQRMKVIRAIDLLDETQDSLDFASQRLDEHSENARSFRARVAYNQYVELIKDLDSQYARNVVDFIEKMRQEGLLVDASLLD